MIMIDTIDSIGDGMIAVAVIMATTVFTVTVAIIPTTGVTGVGIDEEKQNE